MKKEKVNLVLTIVALVPMTFFLIFSLYGMTEILSDFQVEDTMLLLSMIFGTLGYLGLLMNLKQNKKIKAELTNFIFLILGIVGFIFFNSFGGGTHAWKWIMMIEEPDEWIMFVGPILITIVLAVIKGRHLTTLYKRDSTSHSAK